MSKSSTTTASNQDIKIAGPIAEQLLDHLRDENAALAAMLGAVRDVHQALMHLDDEALQRSLAAEARELSSSVAIQQRRQKLQTELAEVLHVAPQEITLRRLANLTTGSVRESLDGAWRSLTEMATEVDRLNRQNAAMIGQSLSIVRGVIERITGMAAVGESYDASGGRAESHVGPLVQWGA